MYGEKKNTGILRGKNEKNLIKAMSGFQNTDICFVR